MSKIPKPPIRNPHRWFETQAVENTQKSVDDQPRKTSKIAKPSIRNPCRRFETHAVENTHQNQNQTKTKATPLEQTHSKKIITGATIKATDNQPNRSTHRSTDPNPPSTDPSPPIQTQLADPRRSNLQNPKPSTGERQREEVRVRMREGENKILFLVLQLCYSAILSLELYCNSIAKFFAILEFRILWCSDIWGCKCQILLTFGISILQC